MPIFEYRCADCRKKFEKIVLSAQTPATAQCPKCGKKGAERVVSRFATASKGGGDDWGGDFGSDDGGGDDGGGGGDMGGMDDGGMGGMDDGGDFD